MKEFLSAELRKRYALLSPSARRVRRQLAIGFLQAGFPRGASASSIASGIRGKAPRLPQTASWHRRERVCGLFEPAHDFFKAHQGALKIWLLGRFQLFRSKFDSRRFLSELLLLAMQTAVRGTSALLDAPDGTPTAAARQFLRAGRRRRIFSSPWNHHCGSRKSGGGSRQHSKARWRTDTIALWSFAESVRLREFAGRRGSSRACQSASAE